MEVSEGEGMVEGRGGRRGGVGEERREERGGRGSVRRRGS